MIKPPQLEKNAPWKVRFRVPHVAWVQTARGNPARGIASSTKSGQYQLYAWSLAANELRQLTYRPVGVPFGTISPDGRYVYYLEDSGGNEIGHFVRIPFEGGQPQDITPERPPYDAFGISSSRAGNLLGTTIADDEGFHTVVLPVDTNGTIGKLREIHHSKKLGFGPSLSHGGKIGVITTSEHTRFQHYRLIALDTRTGRIIAELKEKEEAGLFARGFSPQPGDFRFMATSSRSGFNLPVVWNPITGEKTDLVLPQLKGDVSPLDWSPDGKHILLSQSYQARQRLAIYDITTTGLALLAHPAGHHGMTAFSDAGDEILTLWEDPTHPPQLIALDSRTGAKKRTVLPAGDVPPGHPWKHITFTSVDGETIQGWLGLPGGKGTFPTVLHTHGGPETATVEYFLPYSQAWLDHGYAWLAINYRGSTGFGRAFREKIWGNPGYWEVEDMVAARDWLIKERIAIPDKIMLTGWSYGGYLTLQALGKYPDLWAGGMAGTATTDWAMEYEDLSPALRGYSAALFGGSPQEKPEQYAKSSPITYAENVKAPVLIIQGRNDTRTPARPVEVYEARLRALGKPIEVHWYEEGHLGGGVEQDIEHMEIMLRFAYRVLTSKF